MVVSQRNELRQKIVGRLRTWAFGAGHVAFWSAPLWCSQPAMISEIHGVCFALVLDKFGCELYCCLLCKHSLRNLMQCSCELPTTVTNSWKMGRRFLELAGHCLKVEWCHFFFLVLKWRYRIEILECTWPCYERSVALEILNHIRSTSYHLFENMKAYCGILAWFCSNNHSSWTIGLHLTSADRTKTRTYDLNFSGVLRLVT